MATRTRKANSVITEVELEAAPASQLYEIARLRGERAADLLQRIALHWLESDGERARAEAQAMKEERDAAEMRRLERQRNRYRKPRIGGR